MGNPFDLYGKMDVKGLLGGLSSMNTAPYSGGTLPEATIPSPPQNQYDFKKAFSGIDPNAGGKDMFGNPVPGMVPGGGVLSGLGQVATGIFDLTQYGNRVGEQRGYLKQAERDQGKFFAAEKAGKYDPKVAQAQRDLAMAGIRPTDTSGIKSAAQTAFQAMQSDPRLAASMMSTVQRNQAQQEQSQKMADMQRELGAMSNLANLEQNVLDQKTSLDRELGLMGLNRAYSAEAQAKQNIEALNMARQQAVGNIIGGGINTAIGAFSGFKDGGQVQKTPGEFSHKSNPIDIMKDGAKVGEMTGGEYILNPTQAKSIKGAYDKVKNKGNKASSSDFMKLYKSLDKVLSQPQFS